MLFHWAGASTEKAFLWGPIRWHYLMKGTWNMPSMTDEWGKQTVWESSCLANSLALCHVGFIGNDQHLPKVHWELVQWYYIGLKRNTQQLNAFQVHCRVHYNNPNGSWLRCESLWAKPPGPGTGAIGTQWTCTNVLLDMPTIDSSSRRHEWRRSPKLHTD